MPRLTTTIKFIGECDVEYGFETDGTPYIDTINGLDADVFRDHLRDKIQAEVEEHHKYGHVSDTADARRMERKDCAAFVRVQAC